MAELWRSPGRGHVIPRACFNGMRENSLRVFCLLVTKIVWGSTEPGAVFVKFVCLRRERVAHFVDSKLKVCYKRC